MMSFNDKVVLVAGGSSGIGAAIAIKFAELGAKVAIVGRKEQKLNEVAKKCNNPLTVVADVTKDSEVKRIVDETIKKFGKLDILINSTGIGGAGTITEENTMSVFDSIMATNLRAAVNLTHHAAPHIIKTKGSIISVSSVVAYQVTSKISFAYNTAKVGLDHFTRSVAAELASSGVRVNTVNPSLVRSDLLPNMGFPEDQQEGAYEFMKTTTALGRISEPEEVADVVLFLASDKAKAITGASLVCDNGLMIKAN